MDKHFWSVLARRFGQSTYVTSLREHRIGVIVIVGLTILMCRNLLFSPDFPAGTDMLGYINVGYLTDKLGMFHIWNRDSFGYVDHFTLRLPLSIMLTMFPLNSMFLIKVFIITTFLLSGISMYFVTYYYARRKVASIFSSIVFLTNQWHISQQVSGHLNHTFAYAILPVLFFSFDRSLKSGKLKPLIVFSIVSTLIFLCRFDPVVYTMFLLALHFLFTILICPDGTKRKIVSLNALKVISIGILLVFLFSAFQLIPILIGVRAAYGSLTFPVEENLRYSFGFLESFSGVARELGYLTTRGGIWWDKHPFLNLLQYRIVMSVLPILAFSTIFFRKNKQVLFFVFSALVSVFLAKGSLPPFGEVFLWLYFNVPFFSLLHVPNRWLMITYFSYAFLGGITVDAIFSRLQNFTNLCRGKLLCGHSLIRKTVKSFPCIFLIFIIIPMFFPSWYVLSDGLQTWRPPEHYVQPHSWISKLPNEFRVATLPYDQGWMFLLWEQEGWWEHDLGSESSLFHGRPVIALGGWNPYARDFVRYTNRLISVNGTDDLMKILGTFNVKYLVDQGYLPTEALPQGYSPAYQHYFFSRQEGLQPVYFHENSTVFQNEFWTPHIFPISRYATVVGGREAFATLTTVDNFDLSDWNLLFADQIVNQLGADQLLELLNESPLLILVNSEPLDLAMLTLENAIRIKAVDYAYPSTNKHRYWIGDDWCTTIGTLVLNRHLLSTSGNVYTTIPINVGNSGQYDIWIRILYGPSRGNLSITMDGAELGSIVPQARNYSGLKWTKIGSAQLEQGKHDISLTNKKSTIEWAPGESNDIDEILLVKPQHLQSAINQTTRLLQQTSARMITIIEGEQMFKWATTPDFGGWWTTEQPFDASGGYIALTTNETAWIPLEYSMLKDGRYGIALRANAGTAQGTARIVIDDTHEFLLNTSSQEPAFKWIISAPITLQAGNHTFDLYGEGRVEIDQIVIYSLNQGEDKITLDDVFKTQKSQSIISYEMINPTKYTVHVKTSAPFFLVFSEAYHNLWKAHVDGEEVQSIPAYSFINTFQISKTGEYDIVIEFIGQRYVVYGGIISIISMTLAIIYLAFGTKINRFVVRQLKLEQKRGMKGDQ